MKELLTYAIFGSFTWFCIISILLLATFFWSERDKQGEIAFLGVVVFLTLNYIWGNVPIMKLITWANVIIIIYFSTGLIYAILKSYFLGRSMSKES